MAKLIKTDGTVEEVSPANGVEFMLEEMQKMVGGYIEIVRFPDGVHTGGFRWIVCNEDGIRLDLPRNVSASTACGIALRGDVVLCKDGEID